MTTIDTKLTPVFPAIVASIEAGDIITVAKKTHDGGRLEARGPVREEDGRLVMDTIDRVVRFSDGTLGNSFRHAIGSAAWRLISIERPVPVVEEPTGLGAVVRDGAGVLWVLADPNAPASSIGRWARPTAPGGLFDWSRWSGITARGPVEVISQGVGQGEAK